MIIAGCAGKFSSSPSAISLPELQSALQIALHEAGIDPSRATASAPAGSDNTVFDLGVELDDTDGPGGNLPTAIRLRWTERLLGDYDQNGEVNASDLKPLGQYYRSTVSYDDPGLHGGFDGWPTGDPDGSAAMNWFLARVDGDGNTELYLPDLTAIAKHWKQSISGWRVYAKAPGESTFSLLPNPGGGGDPFTLAHGSPDPESPLRYWFTAASGSITSGQYSFYVAAYDSLTDRQGPLSSIVTVNVDDGAVNIGPAARLTVSPEFAGAPEVITLDASGSYDLDGTVASYTWDIDGDGTADYSSTDAAPPKAASGGLVREIKPAGVGRITAKFFQGSPNYYYPRVRVTDDEGAISPYTSAQLGLSGWVEDERLFDPETLEGTLPLEPWILKWDPVKDTLVTLSGSWPEFGSNAPVKGRRLAVRRGVGDWDYGDPIPIPAPPKEHQYWHDIDFFGDEDGRPIIILQGEEQWPFVPIITTTYAAHQLSSGEWDFRQAFTSPMDKASSEGTWTGADGMVTGAIRDRLAGSSSPDTPTHLYIVTYKDEVWSQFDTGLIWPPGERTDDVVSWPPGSTTLLEFSSMAGRSWQYPDQLGPLMQFGNGGNFHPVGLCWGYSIGPNGIMWMNYRTPSYENFLHKVTADSAESITFPTSDNWTSLGPVGLVAQPDGGLLMYCNAIPHGQVVTFLWQNGTWTEETVFVMNPEIPERSSQNMQQVVSPEGQNYVVAHWEFLDESNALVDEGYSLFKRVDPRQ